MPQLSYADQHAGPQSECAVSCEVQGPQPVQDATAEPKGRTQGLRGGGALS